ncbi:MAG: RluA family pseudouridine synthase [Deltaproteobacteria bacterium]|nr:RluA family pseudouridine synthase [Deltaproteobacteria bacterium]
MSISSSRRRFVAGGHVAENQECDIESFLRDHAGLQPRSKIKRAFLSGGIRLNGKHVTRTRRIKTGDVVEVEMDGLYLKAEARIAPNEKLPLVILTQTPELVAVNKPTGQNAHPLGPSETNTAINALASRFPETALAFRPEKPLEGGLVHRIDRGTSGILVCARTREAWERIRRHWRAPSSEKVYLAWLTGALDAAMTVECWLARDPKSAKRMRVSPTKPLDRAAWKAETSFLTIRHTELATLALIRIHTGVTHQIRATAQTLGHPVAGDAVYLNEKKHHAARIIHREPLAPATRALLESLRERISPENLGGAASAPATKIQAKAPPRTGEDAGAFLLHALWLRVDGIEGLTAGIYCPPPGSFAR